MSKLYDSILLLTLHFRCAGYAALVFTLGLISSVTVVKYRVEVLIAFPRWLAGKLQKMVRIRPIGLFLIIFGFNGAAMCIYMLTGIVHYLAPVFIAYMTGTNLGVVSYLAVSSEPDENAPLLPRPGRQRLAMLCGFLTALLEIPSFWLAIAMGMTLGGFGASVEDLSVAVDARLTAYCCVILPILFVSAAIETLGIKLMIVEKRENDN